jgi:hypothetical protein
VIFLIDYSRSKGELVKLRSFADSERGVAEEARLELELSNSRDGIAHEVVILEARDEAVLRRTHRRYFEDLAGLAKEAVS